MLDVRQVALLQLGEISEFRNGLALVLVLEQPVFVLKCQQLAHFDVFLEGQLVKVANLQN